MLDQTAVHGTAYRPQDIHTQKEAEDEVLQIQMQGVWILAPDTEEAMKRAWLFGAGSAMRTVLDAIGDEYEILGVMDNDASKWDTAINGYTCVPPAVMSNFEGVYIISSFFETEIAKQLVELGAPKEKILGYSATVKPQESDPNIMMEEPLDLFAGWKILGDNESRCYYADLIKSRLTKSPVDMSNNPMVSGWYIYEGMDDIKTVVDCGANVGNATKYFLEQGASHIYAIEPEVVNFQQLVLAGSQVEPIYAAVGDRNGFCKLELGKACGQHKVVDGDGDTPIITIDSLRVRGCDLIKMDIEGYELKALVGAKETIETYRPHLAISAYHKPKDIYELPLYIAEVHPFYRIYMGQLFYPNIGFAGNANETVMYCVGR